MATGMHEMRGVHYRFPIAVLLAAISLGIAVPSAEAYSVLGHEATVDGAWDDLILPLLKQRFPRATADSLMKARAYAYGGAVIQDLGYYPFGSHFFTNLVHYVRSGDFVEALVRRSQDVNDYAFALGAMAHYASDNAGHPLAVNRVVPLMYPKVRAQVGDRALYADNPKRHVMVEFAYDVSQVARGAYAAEAYHDFIGFEVPKRVLERAFLDTYGVEMKDVFLNVDLAIGTYRYAVSKTIPEMTRIAWRDKRDEILKTNPNLTRDRFVFSLTQRDFENDFGTMYRKPSMVSRVLAFFIKILPKVGPLSALAFKPLTPDAERLFLESAARTLERYRALLRAMRRDGAVGLPNTDFDTGESPTRGRNPLADETFDELSMKLTGRGFAAATSDLRRELRRFAATAPAAAATTPVRR